MRIHRQALKREARLCMHSARPNACLMTFVYLLLTAGLSLVVGLVTADPLVEMLTFYDAGLDPSRALMLTVARVGAVGLFLNILMLIYNVVMDFGYSQWCLGTTRGGIGEFADLMSGFSMVGRVLLLRIATLLYCLMWLVVIIMLMVGVIRVVVAISFELAMLVATPVSFAVMALYVICILRYSMAIYCLMDEPEKGVFHALHSSLQLMRGRCVELFLLLLSFFGWYLLGAAITGVVETVVIHVVGGINALLGLGTMSEEAIQSGIPMAVALTLSSWPLSVWLNPYVTMTRCKYYDYLKKAEPVTYQHQ